MPPRPLVTQKLVIPKARYGLVYLLPYTVLSVLQDYEEVELVWTCLYRRRRRPS
jgi:hypothetical protein